MLACPTSESNRKFHEMGLRSGSNGAPAVEETLMSLPDRDIDHGAALFARLFGASDHQADAVQ